MIVERSPAPLDRDLADVSSTAACDPSCSPAYSSSCSSPCSPYSDSEGSLSGSSNGSAWNVGGDHTRGGKQTKATFQGVRVRNSVKELLMHIRNSKLVSSTYGGEEFKGGWNIEQYRELNNIWSNTKRSYGYSSEGPACKRPTTFQTPPLLTPLHTPNSIDRMDDHHKNETRNKSCEMLQNIINIKNESSPVSLNTVQVSWMSSPVNSEQSLEEQYQDIQVKQTQECQVLKASSPQVMDQSQMCDFPYWSSQGLQTPFAHHSLTDSSQLSANCQFPNYEKGLFSSCQEVLYWPDQSFAYCLNETEGCPDTNIPVQLQPKASAQSLNYSPVSSNTVCCQQVLAGSCSSISPQCPSGDGNEVATMQPSKSFFQWQLDQEELRMANITQEQLLAKDSDGDTFLHIAVAQGRRARSYVLARKMAAVNKLDIKEHNNQTALQVAVAANQHLIVQDLVGLGAQVNTTDCWGRTPLHVCAEKGYSQVLQAIQKGVNGNNQYVDAEATNYDGITALHCAVMAHNAVVHGMPKNQQPHTPEVQELLLKSKGLVDTIKMLIEMGASVSARDRKSGRSALYLAAEEANLELIRLFLDLPNALCFVNAKAYNGNTALHVAASLQYRVTQLDTVRLLMRKGADPSARNLENEQPVHLVADGPVGEQEELQPFKNFSLEHKHLWEQSSPQYS